MDQQTTYAMHELSQQLKTNGPALAQLAQFMPVIEMNALTQICSNPQLSEEARSIAAARLDDIVKKTYGNQYSNDAARKIGNCL